MRRRLRISLRSMPLTVGDQLEQSAVGIAEVHARAATLPAGALRRAELDLHAVREQVRHGFLGCAVPDEAEVAVARPHGIGGARNGARAGAVDVQLLAVRELVRVAAARDLGHVDPEHVRVEAVGALVVGDGDDYVVDSRCGHGRNLTPVSDTAARYSHSIVAGGFDVTSSTT